MGNPGERPRPGKKPCLDETGEAQLIAEARSKAPGGRERWTMQLLADGVIELQVAESCHNSCGEVLAPKHEDSQQKKVKTTKERGGGAY